jgi:hypothetical protein
VVDQICVQAEEGRAGRIRGHGRGRLHLVQMVDRPGVERGAERVGRLDRDHAIVRPLELREGDMQPLERPEHLIFLRIAGDAEAGDMLGRRRGDVESARGLARQVE